MRPCHHPEKYEINFTEDAVPSAVQWSQGIAYAYMEKLNVELEKLQAVGVITPVIKPTR